MVLTPVAPEPPYWVIKFMQLLSFTAISQWWRPSVAVARPAVDMSQSSLRKQCSKQWEREKEREKAVYILFSGSRAQFIIREDWLTVLIKKLPYSARSSILIEDSSKGFKRPGERKTPLGQRRSERLMTRTRVWDFSVTKHEVSKQTSSNGEESRRRRDYAAEKPNLALFRYF